MVPEVQVYHRQVPDRAVDRLQLRRRCTAEARPIHAREQEQQAAGLPLTKVLRSAVGGLPMVAQRRGAAVEIVALHKEYASAAGSVIALVHINLRVSAGEVLCIVGPSGCGKSTLLRILAGLVTQSSGTINVDAAGWPVQNAMVFQESGLFPWMSVATNVGFGLMTRGVPAGEAAERVEAALKLVGLTKFRN